MNVTLLNHKEIFKNSRHKICDGLISEVGRQCEAPAGIPTADIKPGLTAYVLNVALPKQWRDIWSAHKEYRHKAHLERDDALGKIYGELTRVAALADDFASAGKNTTKFLRFFKNPKNRCSPDLAYSSSE